MGVFLVRVVRGPGWDPAVGRREQAGWDAHAAFMDGLVADGTVLLGGPVGDGTDVVLAVEAADEADLRRRFAADPWASPRVVALGSVEPWALWLDGRRRPDPVAAIQAYVRRVRLPDWPVYELAGEPGWLAGGSEDGTGAVGALRVDHRPPGAAERLVVQSQPDRGHWPDLAAMIRRLTSTDEDAPLDLGHASAGEDGSVLIDGRPVPAQVHRTGDGTAWAVRDRGVLVVVAVHGVPLDQVTLRRVIDLAPLQERRDALVAELLARS